MNTLPELYQSSPEGQFLERKFCFNKRTKTPKPLPLKKVSAEITETLVAFANADGGELVIGLDDNGAPSGLPFNDKQLAKLLEIPSSRIAPPLSAKSEIFLCGGQKILLFETGPSLGTHRTTAGRYLYRDHDQNMPMDANWIAHTKALKKQSLTEHAFVPGAGMADLREDLVQRVAEKFRPGITAKQALIELRLAEPQNGDVRLSFAALLLFARDPERWHEKAYVEYIRFRGIQREHGAKLNIVQRERISAPLAELSEKVVETIKPHIGQRQVLHDLFFSENEEYPQYAWQEAVVNAIAHRDYGLRGTPVEVHHYDDRLEVVSPGSLVPPITLDILRKGAGGHASRNPLIVRSMVIVGLMREVGAQYQKLAALDIYTASQDIKELIRKGLIRLEKKGGRVYRLAQEELGTPHEDFQSLAGVLTEKGRLVNGDLRRIWGLDRQSALRRVKSLVESGWLAARGNRRGRYYVAGPKVG